MHLVRKDKFRDTQRKNAALSKKLQRLQKVQIWAFVVTGTSTRLLNWNKIFNKIKQLLVVTTKVVKNSVLCDSSILY